MPLSSLIADTRKAVSDDPANALALFAAQGTLVGVTEVDMRTGEHSFKVDEPPAPIIDQPSAGGWRAAPARHLLSLARCWGPERGPVAHVHGFDDGGQ